MEKTFTGGGSLFNMGSISSGTAAHMSWIITTSDSVIDPSMVSTAEGPSESINLVKVRTSRPS